ncbi:MAG TPA: DUF1801 domain-containing protein [Rectinemataceae bacterium]|nr:DUF1801 domain-containing protein [Rectinemataceae bacterium]
MKDESEEVEAYIGQFPEATRTILQRLRATIREAAPGAEERISYRMPAYFLDGPLVYYGAYARHVGFYPTGSGIEAFAAELSAYKHDKGSIQFPLDKALPYELVARITKFKVQDNARRVAEKREAAAEKPGAAARHKIGPAKK